LKKTILSFGAGLIIHLILIRLSHHYCIGIPSILNMLNGVIVLTFMAVLGNNFIKKDG